MIEGPHDHDQAQRFSSAFDSSWRRRSRPGSERSGSCFVLWLGTAILEAWPGKGRPPSGTPRGHARRHPAHPDALRSTICGR